MQSRNIPITVAVAAAASVAMAWRVLSRAMPEGSRSSKGGTRTAEGGERRGSIIGGDCTASGKQQPPSATGKARGGMTPTMSDDELLQDDSRVEVEELGKYYNKYSALYHLNAAAAQLLPYFSKEVSGRGILGFVRDADDDYRSSFDVQWVDLGLGVRIPFSSTQLRILHVDRQGGTGGGVVRAEGDMVDVAMPAATNTGAWAEGALQPTVTIKLAVEKAAVDQQGKSVRKTPWGSAAREGAFPLPYVLGYDTIRDYPDSGLPTNRSSSSSSSPKSEGTPFLAAPTVDLSVEVAGVEELAEYISVAKGGDSTLLIAEAAREALIARVSHHDHSFGNSRDPSDAGGDSFLGDAPDQEQMRITSKPTLSTVVRLEDGTSSTLDIPSLQCCYVVEKECLSVLPAPSASVPSSATSSVVGGSPVSQTTRTVISELRHVWYLFRASPDQRTVITVRMDSLAPEPPHPPSWFLNLARGAIFTADVSPNTPPPLKTPSPPAVPDTKTCTATQVVLPSLVPSPQHFTSASSLFCCEPRHGFGFHVPLGFEAIPEPILVEEADLPGIDTMLGYVARRPGGDISPHQQPSPEMMASDTLRPPPYHDGSPPISFSAHPSIPTSLSSTAAAAAVTAAIPPPTEYRAEDWSEENLLSSFFAEGAQGEDTVGPTGPAIKRRSSTKDESSSFLTLRSSFSTTTTRRKSGGGVEMDHHRIVIDAKYEHLSTKNPWDTVIPQVLKRVAERFRLSDEGGIPYVLEGSPEAQGGGGHRHLKGRGVSEPLLVMRSFMPDPSFLTPIGAPRNRLLEAPAVSSSTINSNVLSPQDDVLKAILHRDTKTLARAVERGCPGAALLSSSDDVSPRPHRRSAPLSEGYFGAIDVLLKPPSGLIPVRCPNSGDSVASGILDVGALSTDGCQVAALCVYILPVGGEFISVTFVAKKTSTFRMKSLLELSSYVMNSVSLRNFHGQIPSVRYVGIPPACASRKGWGVTVPYCFKVGAGVTVSEPRVADPAVVLSVHPDGCQDALVPRILQRGWSSRVSKRARRHADRLVNALFSPRLSPTSSPLPRSIVTIRTCPCPPRLCKPAIDSPNDISRIQLKSFAQECIHLIYNLGESYTDWCGPASQRSRQQSLQGESPATRSNQSQGMGSGIGAGSESGGGGTRGAPSDLVLETECGGVAGGGHVVVRDVRAFPARPRTLPLSLRHTTEPSMIVSFIIEHDHYLGLGDVTEYLEEKSVASMATDLGYHSGTSSPKLATEKSKPNSVADGSRMYLQGIEPSDATIACPSNPFLWYLPPVATIDSTCCLEAAFPKDSGATRVGSVASSVQGDATSPQPSRLSIASRSSYVDDGGGGQSQAVRGGLDENWIRRVSAVVCVDNTAYIIQASTVNLGCVEQWTSLKEYVRQMACSWVA